MEERRSITNQEERYFLTMMRWSMMTAVCVCVCMLICVTEQRDREIDHSFPHTPTYRQSHTQTQT